MLVIFSVIRFDHIDSTHLWMYLLSKRISIILESLEEAETAVFQI